MKILVIISLVLIFMGSSVFGKVNNQGKAVDKKVEYSQKSNLEKDIAENFKKIRELNIKLNKAYKVKDEAKMKLINEERQKFLAKSRALNARLIKEGYPLSNEDKVLIKQKLAHLNQKLKRKKQSLKKIKKFYKLEDVKEPDDDFLKEMASLSLGIEKTKKRKKNNRPFIIRRLADNKVNNLAQLRYMALNVDDEELKHDLIIILGTFRKDKKSENLLTDCLDSRNREIQKDAFWGLNEIKSKKCVPKILNFFNNNKINTFNIQPAIVCLGRSGLKKNIRDKVIQVLKGYLDSSDAKEVIKKRSLESLGSLKCDEVVPIIMPYLNHKNWMYRCRALKALIKLEKIELLPVILKKLDDPEAYVQDKVVLYLGSWKHPKIILILEDLLQKNQKLLTESKKNIEKKMRLETHLRFIKISLKNLKSKAGKNEN